MYAVDLIPCCILTFGVENYTTLIIEIRKVNINNLHAYQIIMYFIAHAQSSSRFIPNPFLIIMVNLIYSVLLLAYYWIKVSALLA